MLDPDWTEFRKLAHRELDAAIDRLARVDEAPVWRAMPETLRARVALPRTGVAIDEVFARIGAQIAPYVTGNTHPRFMGWVHGGGNAVSALAEALAGFLNANCGGRDHAGIAVERQVIAWAAEMLGMPAETTGVLLTGSSMANFHAVLCARTRALAGVRASGVGGGRLVGYAAESAHRCVAAAFDMAGLGRQALRLVTVDGDFRMRVDLLEAAIAADRAAGLVPFVIVGTAGSVDVGAIDDLEAIAAIAAREGIWFHADAAFGALARLTAAYAPALAALGRADSVAFDFHKWAQVTYDAGCVLVRDPAAVDATFAVETNYLQAAARGLAGGAPWPCDLGPDLSRGFRALKIWATLMAFGTDGLAAVVENSCRLARRLAELVDASAVLERLAPVPLNIVNFAPRSWADGRVADLVADLQEEGLFAPSTTRIGGRLAIRCAIVNHRTRAEDVDALVGEIERRVRS